VCGSCAGTNATCTTCIIPSKYPLYKDYQCVDSCGSGYFFDQDNLRCFQCSHTCQECYGPGDGACLRCAAGYFLEDGVCRAFCSKNLREDLTQRACVTAYLARCEKPCLSCSQDPSFCLSCDPKSIYPLYDPSTGRCLPRDKTKCGMGLSQ
jgi:proprotein convertase subtilisin/kexin type 6